MFSSFIHNYTHWGWGCLDVIYGKIMKFIESTDFKSFDIITFSYGDNKSIYLRGQLTIFKKNKRNNEIIQNAYMNCIKYGFPFKIQGTEEQCFSYFTFLNKRINIKILPFMVMPFNDENFIKNNYPNNKEMIYNIGRKVFYQWKNGILIAYIKRNNYSHIKNYKEYERLNHNLIYFGEKNDWRISIFTIYILN